MSSRKTTSPILCLILAYCVAWPAPLPAQRSVDFSSPTSAALTSFDQSRLVPRLLAHPFHPDDSSTFAPGPTDFDDGEDSDDLVPQKRYPSGHFADRSGFPRASTGVTLGRPFWSIANPMPTSPRHAPIRC